MKEKLSESRTKIITRLEADISVRLYNSSELDKSGNNIVQYTYDAWGNHTVSGTQASTIGAKNPFRYRSYFYDTETQLYYLKTRYYDPEIGRFLNMDSVDYADPTAINGLNLYAYCCNNPVTYSDPDGHSIILACIIIGAVIGAAAGGTLAYYNAKANGATGAELFGWTLLGVIGGAAVGAVAGAVAGAGVALGGAGLSAMGSGALALAGGGTIASGGALVAVGAGAFVAGGALAVGGVLGGLEALNILLVSTGNRGGYWGQKYSDDHDPEHIHLKGTDGTNIRIGRDGNPLAGEPNLKPQQRKALKRLWKEFLKLFG